MQSPEEALFVQKTARSAAARAADAFWNEEREGSRINHMRFDQLNEGNPQTLAVGCPFCMIRMEDAMTPRSMEEQMRVRDISELIPNSTGAVESK
jgi:Fe-S oxidoreductase